MSSETKDAIERARHSLSLDSDEAAEEARTLLNSGIAAAERHITACRTHLTTLRELAGFNPTPVPDPEQWWEPFEVPWDLPRGGHIDEALTPAIEHLLAQITIYTDVAEALRSQLGGAWNTQEGKTP